MKCSEGARVVSLDYVEYKKYVIVFIDFFYIEIGGSGTANYPWFQGSTI